MNMHVRWLTVAAAAAAVGLLSGCQTKQLQADRDALRNENLELRSELDTTRSALETATGQRDDLESSNANMQAKLSQRNAAPPLAMSTVGTNTPFDSIKGVETSRGHNSITVRVPGNILFDSGKATLKSSAKRTLNQIASVIKSDYRRNTIRIAGFTDSDPIRKSKWKDNLELSSQRAMAVHRQLQKQGIDPHNMYAAGYGKAQARASKSKSRRVEIIVELN